jgi:hypothetical protein
LHAHRAQRILLLRAPNFDATLCIIALGGPSSFSKPWPRSIAARPPATARTKQREPQRHNQRPCPCPNTPAPPAPSPLKPTPIPQKKYPLILTRINELTARIAALGPEAAVDVDQAALRVTLDVIGLAGFGHDYQSVKQDKPAYNHLLVRECLLTVWAG